MAAVSISANMDERDARRVRMIAEKEHRSVSNFIANAVFFIVGGNQHTDCWRNVAAGVRAATHPASQPRQQRETDVGVEYDTDGAPEQNFVHIHSVTSSRTCDFGDAAVGAY